jgi:urea carboxylase
VWSVLVAAGDEVDAGQALLVLESMKMEVAVHAPSAGRIERVLCSEGQPVTAGQALVVMR